MWQSLKKISNHVVSSALCSWIGIFHVSRWREYKSTLHKRDEGNEQQWYQWGGGQGSKYYKYLNMQCKHPFSLAIRAIPDSNGSAQDLTKPNSSSCTFLSLPGITSMMSGKGCLHSTLWYMQYFPFCSPLATLLINFEGSNFLVHPGKENAAMMFNVQQW